MARATVFAINAHVAAGKPIGGTSAGLAVQGEFAYGALGDRDRAFQWLEQVWQRRICYLLKIHPFLDPLRADPRYAGYLKRAGLAD